MGRAPCCAKEGLNRRAWTAAEDKILRDYIKSHGEGKWRSISKNAGLKRCGKSCRLRWLNYLKPDIKRGNVSNAEEDLIIRLHRLLGNRWSLIAKRLPGRTDNEIKNYWNANLRKKVESKKSEKAEEPAGIARSNASGCSGVFITPQSPKVETATEPSMINPDDLLNNAAMVESEYNDGIFSLVLEVENSADLAVDGFDLRDFSPSDGSFNCELGQACNLENMLEEGSINGDANDHSWPSSEQLLLLPHELKIKEWVTDDWIEDY